MPKVVADYALLGDRRTGALVDSHGSVAWWCAPRFDSGALFASLLGDAHQGAWRIAPSGAATRGRRYVRDTLVLETTVETASGHARQLDFMPADGPSATIVRIVEGVSGSVAFEADLEPRMHYGQLTPRSRGTTNEWTAQTGPDAVCLRSDAPLNDRRGSCRSEFTVAAGERVRFVLSWYPAHESPPPPCDADASLEQTTGWWERWASGLTYAGPWRERVVRSAIVLKALSDRTTGGLVAAVTTSLPEQIGGTKNWDYRYCWLRDASFSAASLLRLGRTDEAGAFRDWFMRVYAGDPEHLHIMYGIGGERLGPEYPLPWLDGFAGSSPVRVGNGAHDQLQLGVLGHVLRCFVDAAAAGVPFAATDWDQLAPIQPYLEERWRSPGNGIWETRHERHQYVDSKVMVWSAIESLQKLAAACGVRLDGSAATALAAQVREEVERAGYDPQRRTFTQSYGSQGLDASALLMPIVGFLAADDPRMVATVAALERELMRDGFVYRYSKDVGAGRSGGSASEGTFTMCGFWLVEVLARSGRRDEAVELFERLAGTANDVGLLTEEYDVDAGVAIGNVPQAFSHCGLIDAAVRLAAG